MRTVQADVVRSRAPPARVVASTGRGNARVVAKALKIDCRAYWNIARADPISCSSGD